MTEYVIPDFIGSGKAPNTRKFPSVTDKQIEAELDEVKKRFQSLMDNCVDGLIVIDEDGSILEFNLAAEEIFGYTAADVAGKNVSMLMPEPYRAHHDRYLGNYLNTGDAKIIGIGREVIGQRRDGSVFPMELSVGEMPDSHTRNFVGTVRDISERRQIENRLLQASKMEAIGELTGGIAHDFNNLLAIMMMDLEMLQDVVADSNEGTELVAEALEVTRTGANLTQRLLAFSRRQALNPADINLNELVLSITGLLRRTIGESIQIDTIGPQDLWPVTVDQGQLENALINLAINGRDAMPDGGRLSIICENISIGEAEEDDFPELVVGDYARLSMTDSGTGMDEDVIAHAFEPFFTTKPERQGTGLGLSMVYGFVKQSGGHVSVYSSPGQGTTVNLYFPRSHNTAEPVRTADKKESRMSGSERILIVEDDRRLRNRAANSLITLGYDVVQSANAAAALDLLVSDEIFDLLLTDIVMPGNMNGIELAQRSNELNPAPKILLMTGYAHLSDDMRNLVPAGTKLIQKPFTRDRLALTVREVLDSPP